MANHELNHKYFVDPGIGEKSENCPYSNFSDGRDVDMFITPPNGYILTGFNLEPYDTPDHFYDGKIVAQYEKLSFLYMLKEKLLRYVAALVIVVLVSLIAITIIKRNMTQSEQLSQSNPPVINATPIAVDTTEMADTIALLPDTVSYKSVDTINETINEEIVQEEPLNEDIEQEPAKPIIINEEPIKEEIKEKAKEEVSETPENQPTPAEIKAQFKKEFWTLIHRQEKRMSQYGSLYREYKDNVSGAEFNYLFLNILQSTSDFKIWNQKLNRIPANEIKKVNTITQLIQKIEEYE